MTRPLTQPWRAVFDPALQVFDLILQLIADVVVQLFRVLDR